MAVDALGPDRVRCVMLPYRYTAQASLDDAAAAAQALGVQYDVVPIESAVLGLENTLAPLFEGTARDVTEENLQARARGTILMAISNKFGLMVVTTGNKSEMSVGYATLYGDMNGGFNPIKDIYKTEVYRLARLRNRWWPEDAGGPRGPVVPENIITRAPTAELREDQTDQDTLPPYDVLDSILKRLVEREEPIANIIEAGFDRATVLKIARIPRRASKSRCAISAATAAILSSTDFVIRARRCRNPISPCSKTFRRRRATAWIFDVVRAPVLCSKRGAAASASDQRTG
jgi:NAD+ synthase